MWKAVKIGLIVQDKLRPQKHIYYMYILLYPDEKMSEFETRVIPVFGVACILAAVVLFALSRIASEMSLISLVAGAFFLVLGLASLATWLINRTRRKEGTLFRK